MVSEVQIEDLRSRSGQATTREMLDEITNLMEEVWHEDAYGGCNLDKINLYKAEIETLKLKIEKRTITINHKALIHISVKEIQEMIEMINDQLPELEHLIKLLELELEERLNDGNLEI